MIREGFTGSNRRAQRSAITTVSGIRISRYPANALQETKVANTRVSLAIFNCMWAETAAPDSIWYSRNSRVSRKPQKYWYSPEAARQSIPPASTPQ